MKTEMRTKKRCVLREDEPCVGCMQCMNIFSKKFISAGKAKAKALIYTDMALSLLLPLTLISGLLLHAAGHGFPYGKVGLDCMDYSAPFFFCFLRFMLNCIGAGSVV